MEKLVRDLKPGDIFHEIGGKQRAVVLGAEAARSHSTRLTIISLLPEFQPTEPKPEVCTVTWNSGSKVWLFTPTLTPAQRYADELLRYTKMYESALRNPAEREQLRHLLHKIEPPAPPTLEEAIEVLRDLVSTPTALPAAQALLARVPK